MKPILKIREKWVDTTIKKLPVEVVGKICLSVCLSGWAQAVIGCQPSLDVDKVFCV